ncbi:carbohydrate ABC transporter substrate-binding protein, CUT1 family (TC 3.A.1.1.-) [Paenibacillus algorifonticola]|uniref:Carbohydrate ABC transporter substrate-binding protein, CUT1 family (TC 3.A.1.1.-) n=1 Tax=Paenibacillus algorifonticola TaxID=684063 RepID=A0A1I2IBP2_9BACL|nr:ABC transporter substrate-binding protein [Paenibacillus algorifonticola]SFF39040.1 carbohydrate ABC transporter substrate-binding protein, CUT1 family (TC 3.A.1.1.-) [Paenibacillus algorifonticola]
MKSWKSLQALLVSLVMVMVVTACGGNAGSKPADSSTAEGSANSGSASGDVKITLLNSKGEIQTQLEDAAKAFKEDYPNITLEIIPVPAGQSPFEKASALYAANSPSTITMLDTGDVEKFKDRILDLSEEKWMSDKVDGSTDLTTFDGKNYAFPLSIEGYGFIYNKAVVDKAVGGSFDPATITTTQALGDLFKKIEASGTGALIVSPMDWSLAAHFLPLAYAGQSADKAAVNQFITDLQAGSVDLASNKVFNGLMDTFDLMKEHNIDKASPLAGTYEKGPEVLGKGEVGIWFQGNWAWPQISSFDTASGAYGFLPVPISNNTDDFGNTQISAAVSKRLVLDKEKSTTEQQAAAKTFLEWMVYKEKGQDFLINKANIVPAFKNITLEPKDPLAKSIQAYIAGGKIEESMSALPADHWSKVGASMQKYLAGAADRATLAKEIQEYWTTVK